MTSMHQPRSLLRSAAWTGPRGSDCASLPLPHDYDDASNLTTLRGGEMAYNDDNQILPEEWVFESDGNGNAILHNYVEQTFDVENRLTEVTGGPTYGYTGGGLRAWKQLGSTRTYYLYDGTTLLAEMDASGTLTTVYTTGANGLVSKRVGSTTTYYAYDPQGSVAARLNSASTVVSSDLYDAYGQLRAGNPNSDPVGYNGQWGYYTDPTTGYVLCTFRWYDPTTARWLTRDPIGYSGGINLYGYVGGNPVNWADPSGLKFSYVESKRDPNYWPKIVAQLNHLADSPTARKIILDCQKDPDRFYVFHRRTADPQVAHVSETGQGSTGTYHIYFDPDRNGILVTGSGQALDTPAEVVLIHELGHVNGQTGGVGYPDPGNGTLGATCAPGDVVFEVENRVRRDLGLPNRPDY